ncbi:MAG: transposase [Ethanoligenens sp.]
MEAEQAADLIVPEPEITEIKAEMPKPVIKGGFASPESVAHIAVQKHVMDSPLYRQEQEWAQSGILLSRQTMSNWLIKACEDWLEPIYQEMKRQLCKSSSSPHHQRFGEVLCITLDHLNEKSFYAFKLSFDAPTANRYPIICNPYERGGRLSLHWYLRGALT